MRIQYIDLVTFFQSYHNILWCCNSFPIKTVILPKEPCHKYFSNKFGKYNHSLFRRISIKMTRCESLIRIFKEIHILFTVEVLCNFSLFIEYKVNTCATKRWRKQGIAVLLGVADNSWTITSRPRCKFVISFKLKNDRFGRTIWYVWQ